MFLALRFLACGSFQREYGDIHSVSQSGVSRVVHGVFKAIAGLKQQFITFPNLDECITIQEAFQRKRGFPGVIGAIDGTHIPIQSPGGPDAELYRNRKGFFSINVQLMCDNNLVIRNVVASWKGSTHDARIFNDSTLKDQLAALPGRFHVLGDKGYPCMRYLMTPLSNPRTAAEKQYNFAQSSTRIAVERLNGVIKRRFPCLSIKLRFKPEKCAVIIVACCVLHNFAVQNQDRFEQPDFLEQEAEDDDYDNIGGMNANAQGVAKRRTIIQNYFT